METQCFVAAIDGKIALLMTYTTNVSFGRTGSFIPGGRGVSLVRPTGSRGGPHGDGFPGREQTAARRSTIACSDRDKTLHLS